LEGNLSIPCWVVTKGLRFLDENCNACFGLLAHGKVTSLVKPVGDRLCGTGVMEISEQFGSKAVFPWGAIFDGGNPGTDVLGGEERCRRTSR